MDFTLTEEQVLLGNTVGRFITDRYDFHARETILRAPDGWSRDIWASMAELGLLALPFAEADGGLGAGGVETMLVMEALGSGLVVEPYLSTIVLSGTALSHGGTAAQKVTRIPAIIAGEHLMALAHHEPRGPHHRFGPVRTRATSRDGSWVLDGAKSVILHGQTANELIVSAATASGTTLFLVDPRASGVTLTGRRGYDGHGVAEAQFDSVRVDPGAVLGAEGAGGALLTAMIETATAALCAEAVGAMAATLDTTVEYLKTRRQFGVAIGSFQALQHRAVDMLIQLELARSMATLAALSLASPNADQRARNIAAAKVQTGKSGRFIGQQAVQLHGAIGITAEYKVGHAFKRLTAIDALFGDANQNLDWLAEAGGLYAA
jgi:alkylation response protein AidB-like acyl-CoA dehydrogenase